MAGQRMCRESLPGFFFSSRRRHTRYIGDWSSDVCSSDLCPFATASTAVGGAAALKLSMCEPSASFSQAYENPDSSEYCIMSPKGGSVMTKSKLLGDRFPRSEERRV